MFQPHPASGHACLSDNTGRLALCARNARSSGPDGPDGGHGGVAAEREVGQGFVIYKVPVLRRCVGETRTDGRTRGRV
jgi:hypothetical protein